MSIDAREVRRIAGTASDISKVAADAAQATEVSTAYASDEEGIDDGTNHFSSATVHAGATGSGHRQPDPQRAFRTLSKHGEALVEGGNGHGRWPGRRKGGDDGEQDYTEQLVLFDSLTASLPEVFGPPNAPSGTPAILAAAGASPSGQGSLTSGDHVYHCIQHSKKFHPDFDLVLKGVLQSDPAAKILLTAGSKVGTREFKKRKQYLGTFSKWNSRFATKEASPEFAVSRGIYTNSSLLDGIAGTLIGTCPLDAPPSEVIHL